MPERTCESCGKKETLVAAIRSTKCRSCASHKKRPWRKVPLDKRKGRYLYTLDADGVWNYEHRVIMEKVLGRKLRTDEHVHHINGNRFDNRIENLEVLSCQEHHKEHSPSEVMKERSKLGHKARWGKEY